MQAALNILGLTCYHFVQFFFNIKDCKAWSAALDAEFHGKGSRFALREWDFLHGSFSAVSADSPAVAFAQELVELYPEAKVILVERDIEAWYDSFNSALIESLWSPLLNFLGDLDPRIIGPVRDCHHRWERGWWKADSKMKMQEKARAMYRGPYAIVRRITPKERLLEYGMGDGWEPLCDFSGKPVPEVEFPRVNDQEHMKEFLAIVTRRSVRNALIMVGNFVLPVAVGGAGWWRWNMQ